LARAASFALHAKEGSGMSSDGLTDEAIRALLSRVRRIALVGASNKPSRPSFGVMRFLLAHGFQVVPVNPGLAGQAIHGQAVVGALEQAGTVDMVDVFREASAAPDIARQAVAAGATSLWLQLGVVSDEAGTIARDAGLVFVQDRCPAIEIPRLGLAPVRGS
jgi:predicted CoA-binding protein